MSETTEDEVSRLALAAGAGDCAALQAFVSATRPQVWRVCRALGSDQSADDLIQETYLRAIRSLPGYRAEAPALGWVCRIARNVCADEVRRNRHRRALSARLSHLVDPHPTIDGFGLVDVEAIIAQLPSERRGAFVLTQLLGFPYHEAAEICGCPVGTIRSRLARARDHLASLVREADAV